jgi:hypothetical protein
MATVETNGDAMRRVQPSIFISNVLLMAGLVPLVWLALSWSAAWLVAGPSNSGYEASAFLLNYAFLVPQVMVAGVLQQGTMLLVPERLTMPQHRLIAAIAAFVYVLAVMMLVARGDMGVAALPEMLVPLAVAVAVYVAIMRVPREAET